MAYGNTEIKAALESGRISFQADILRYYQNKNCSCFFIFLVVVEKGIFK
jgi:hypothetical protein